MLRVTGCKRVPAPPASTMPLSAMVSFGYVIKRKVAITHSKRVRWVQQARFDDAPIDDGPIDDTPAAPHLVSRELSVSRPGNPSGRPASRSCVGKARVQSSQTGDS